jgi:uncharacterized membrane protein YagU involved in acid resistance
MTDLAFTAYRHGHVYSHGYHAGWSDWLAHVVLSSVIHAVIYRFVFQLMHRLTLGEAAMLVLAVLAILFA